MDEMTLARLIALVVVVLAVLWAVRLARDRMGGL